jgi:hypothetical protein
LPDISKINALAIGSVSKVDGLAKASILDINGLTIPSAFTGLLDESYGSGASVAYSVRRLYSAYTGACMRVREDGGNTETDIGFDSNGDLDTAAIASHCGANNGFVRYWYDQSTAGGTGSGTDASQGTATAQPQIYDGSGVVTENGKAALDFDGSSDCFDLSLTISASNYGLFYVNKRNTPINGWLLDTESGRLVLDSATNSLYFDGAFRGTHISSTSQNLQFLSLVSPSSGALYTNGTVAQSGISYTQKAFGGDTNIGRSISGFGSAQYRGILQELILYSSDKTGDRSGIETNINGFFGIY